MQKVEWMKLSVFAKRIGFKGKTVWGWYRDGLIPGAFKTPSGSIIVPDSAIRRMVKKGKKGKEVEKNEEGIKEGINDRLNRK